MSTIKGEFQKEIENYISTWGESPTIVQCNSAMKGLLLDLAQKYNMDFVINNDMLFSTFIVKK
jgi:hypothetical protein